MAKIAHRLAVAISLFAGPGAARADAKLEEAKSHLQSGASLYDENNFRGALVEFQKAYDLAPSYKILFNIGQVEMELQDYAGALKAYTRYLKEGGPDVSSDRATQINAEIERLRGRVGFLVVQTAPGAQVVVDDVQVGYAPLSEPVPVAAGQHRVTVTQTGRKPIHRVFDVAGKETVTAALGGNDLAPPASAQTEPPAPPAAPMTKNRTPMYVAWTATGVFAIGAGVFGVIAHRDSGTLSDLRNTFPVTAAQLDSQQSATTRDALITDVFLGATLVAAGIAIYETVTRRSANSERSARLQVAPSGLAVAGRF